MKMKYYLTLLLALALACLPALGQPSPRAEPGPRSTVFVDSLLQAAFPAGGPGAAVMVIRDGAVVHQAGYGLANLETRQPITPTTNFYLASVSKQFTSMAVMMLLEQGKLDLEDRLTDFFPGFPAYGQEVRLRHLLTHTSGLPDYYGLIDDYTGLNNDDVYAILLRQDSLTFPPGARYSYSNSGYVLLSRIVERASGTTFRAFVHEHIFSPLGMAHSVVYDTTAPAVTERALGYQKSDDGYAVLDYNAFTTGGGGLFSSISDLYKWDQALYTGRLVSQGLLARAWAPTALNDGDASNYGYGWGIGELEGRPAFRHSGSLRGFRTFIIRVPEEHLSVILLCNVAHANPSELGRKIAAYYLGGSL